MSSLEIQRINESFQRGWAKDRELLKFMPEHPGVYTERASLARALQHVADKKSSELAPDRV